MSLNCENKKIPSKGCLYVTQGHNYISFAFNFERAQINIHILHGITHVGRHVTYQIVTEYERVYLLSFIQVYISKYTHSKLNIIYKFQLRIS